MSSVRESPVSSLDDRDDDDFSVSLQAVGIMECVLRKFGSYENFEEVTGGSVLPKSRVWAAVRKYLQKEGCVGEVRAACSTNRRKSPVKQVSNHRLFTAADILTCGGKNSGVTDNITNCCIQESQ